MDLSRKLIVILALLALAACGGSDSADIKRPKEDSWESKTATIKVQGGEDGKDEAKPVIQEADFLRVSSVKISPDQLYANVDINAKVIVAPPVPDLVEFEYRWYIDNQQVADVTGPVLKSGNFLKNQWVLCEARAIAGEKTSIWMKSDFVRIADSPPQVEPIAVSSANVPGRFSCQLKASDIDHDELSFELLAPLDQGIILDKKTGSLTWDLDEATVGKLGESVELSISVSDNDTQPTIGSITLHFQKKTEKRNL